MVTTFYPPYHVGGDGIAVQRLAHALVARGHEVSVIHDVDAHRAVHGDVRRPAREDPPGLVVHRLESRIGKLSPLLTQQTGHPVVHGRRIRRILADGSFDVVHFHNVSLVGGPGVLRLAPPAALRLYTAHEHWLVCASHVLWRHDREPCDARECLRCVLAYRRPPQLWRYTGALERAARNVDAFIAMSEFSRAKHREMGFPHEMHVVPGFVDPPRPPVATTGHLGAGSGERPFVLFAGRLVRLKGLDDVIPVFAGRDGADLVVAGDGPHRAALESIANGSPRVRFLGNVARERLDALYGGALATIVPSIGLETFGLVSVEAMAMGCPVIARRTGPLPEIVEASGGGALFDDAAGLARVLDELESDASRRAALAAAGRDAVLRRWTEEAAMSRYLDVVRAAAEARGLERVVASLSRETV